MICVTGPLLQILKKRLVVGAVNGLGPVSLNGGKGNSCIRGKIYVCWGFKAPEVCLAKNNGIGEVVSDGIGNPLGQIHQRCASRTAVLSHKLHIRGIVASGTTIYMFYNGVPKSGLMLLVSVLGNLTKTFYCIL